ncbi:MAG: DEAD/DEAH box helicase [Actinomycetota bacterium]|nr:DEAD/DEAH box helicase [Actinomycetota bacterium]
MTELSRSPSDQRTAGHRSVRLRRWQKTALDRWSSASEPDFLAVATPGAGKTTFALAAVRRELSAGAGRVVIVVPTAHLKRQWARAASRFGVHLDPAWSAAAGDLPADMHGIVTTYQQVASSAKAVAAVLSGRRSSGGVAVLDEVHHAADERAWGDSIRVAFGGARRRILLSGTPFRSDVQAIPFVRYEMEEAVADFEYGYGEALEQGGVVRPIYFPRVDGEMEWTAPDGATYKAGFGDALDEVRSNQRLRTALSLDGDWLPSVLAAAHRKLTQLRRDQPDAGGLVIAVDQEHAQAVARRMRADLGVSPVVATSDDPLASVRIERFAGSDEPWLIAVRMVSEGVDIPRLRVGVFATTTTTELFFRQAVGRFVRWSPGHSRQPSYMFIPEDPRLVQRAAQIAQQRRHVLWRRPVNEQPAEVPHDMEAGPEAAEVQPSLFSVISAVATEHLSPDEVSPTGPGVPADQDRTYRGGHEGEDDDPSLVVELSPLPLGGSLPARSPAGASLLAPDGRGDPGEPPRSEHKQLLRRENNRLARALARRTGWSHPKVNAELNRLAGLDNVTAATVGQLERRLDHARRWLART